MKTVNLNDLPLELQLIPEKIGAAAQQALQLPQMVATAKSFCPIHTGALMSSIRAEQRELYLAILVAGGVNYVNPVTGGFVDYARAVHDGTSRTPARPFLLQAVLAERLNLAYEIIRGSLEGLGV